jgi:uncharacterized protein (DUF1800 family)
MTRAELESERAKLAKRKLAKEVLEEFMLLFGGMAVHYQPHQQTVTEVINQETGETRERNANKNADEGRFRYYATLAVDCAEKLAPY